MHLCIDIPHFYVAIRVFYIIALPSFEKRMTL